MKEEDKKVCGKKCEVYSRVVGYYRPVQLWNAGKQEEFRQRLEYDEKIGLEKEFKVVQKIPLDSLKQ